MPASPVTSLLEQFAASSHLSGGNAAFIEGLYEDFLRDPASVAPQWRESFEQLRGRANGERAHSPIVASLARSPRTNGAAVATAQAAAPADATYARKQAAVLKLVTAYRARGHLAANLDPLGLAARQAAPDLEPSFHGLGEADLQTEFDTGSLSGPKRLKLADLLALLKRTYSSTIGAEFMHISLVEQRQWVHEQLERAGGNFALSVQEKERLLAKLTAAEGLERYLHTKYVGQKRFSLEGGESLIPLMDELVRRGGSSGVREIVIGMAHRGRLNVLVNTLGKPPQQLFAEFEGKHAEVEDPAHSGDVKYHLGHSSDVATPGGPVHLALGFNPSHLEIIGPVVAGSVRARQNRRHDDTREKVMPILLHGDAAFAAQGVVMELFQMSQARGFAVGGTVHVVVNNQVGFTISRPDDARSTLYCTDPAKIVGAPVFHVNGDDPEAVLFCARLAFDYRHTFRQDAVIDLVCYRRHGHNEADEPAATQPVMYQVVRARKTTRELYAERLAQAGEYTAEAAQALVDQYRTLLEAGASVAELADKAEKPIIDWTPHIRAKDDPTGRTAVAREKLDALGARIVAVPADISLHSRVAKIYEDRARMARGELRLDWGYAENLAYATLLDEGHRLRLVGQDSARGTFFHRHAVLHDQKTSTTHTPLAGLVDDPAKLAIVDSLLSEEGVMAFEYGYSTTDPQTLVIWEAQFGDFCNGAQVVIDQFISSGEAKWRRLSGLTLFLPHGYEGQGPEHSSARLERFMQLCALDNMQVCYPTTPAQMFHMLRRQMVRDLRKPLVVMTPKSMLRNKLSTSTLEELASGGFQLVIPDTTVPSAKAASRVVLCSGKVYYDLYEEAQKRGLSDVALVRVEQLYPFPRAQVTAELDRHAGATDVVWCQEEPQNQGAWYQISHRLLAALGPARRLHYAGRPRSPAPASGHHANHVIEQAALVEKALVAPLGSGPLSE